MNDQDFNNLRASIKRVFADLYLIDIDTLNADQRKQHQQSLSSTYLALVNAEHAKFSDLSKEVKAQLTPLAMSLKRLQEEISGLPTPYEKLGAVARGLSVFGQIDQLL